jgi:hypothetical protein
MRSHVAAWFPILPLVLVAACSDADRIEGTWYRKQFANNRPCAEQLELDRGDFVSTILCDLADKQVGAQTTAGRYRQSDNRLFVTADRSTCHQWPKEEVTWVVTTEKNILHRTMGTTTNTFDRGRLDLSANRLAGCFDADLKNFDEAVLQEL